MIGNRKIYKEKKDNIKIDLKVISCGTCFMELPNDRVLCWVLVDHYW
jgi:hypothetical protein